MSRSRSEPTKEEAIDAYRTEVPPTGKPVEVRGMELVVMRDGKIVVDNLYYDLMGLAAQVGLLPHGAAA
jgi:ketosteroid isomerase-like protein